MKAGSKIILFSLALTAAAGCGAFRTYELKSQGMNGEVVIDGRAGDWRGAQFFIEDQQLLLGVKNDSRFLYVCLAAESRFTNMQVMGGGLTVWFDPKGGKEKRWGIQYPLGRGQQEMSFPRRPGEFEDEEREMPERGQPGLEWVADMLKELAIVKPGTAQPVKMSVEQAGEMGLEVSVRSETGYLTYELKVPLQAMRENGPAVGAAAGQTIGLGFEAGELKMRRPGGGMPGGGMGRTPMGGGMGGRGGGMPGGPGEGFGRPERLKIWAIVRLAEGGGVSDATTLELTALR